MGTETESQGGEEAQPLNPGQAWGGLPSCHGNLALRGDGGQRPAQQRSHGSPAALSCGRGWSGHSLVLALVSEPRPRRSWVEDTLHSRGQAREQQPAQTPAGQGGCRAGTGWVPLAHLCCILGSQLLVTIGVGLGGYLAGGGVQEKRSICLLTAERQQRVQLRAHLSPHPSVDAARGWPVYMGNVP